MTQKSTAQARVAACYCVHDDWYYLAESIASVAEAADVWACVSRVPWHGQPGNWERSAAVARQAGAEVVVGEWNSEAEQRNAALDAARARGYTHVFILDGDELLEPTLRDSLLRIAAAGLVDRVYGHMATYWHSPDYIIRPREALTPVLLVALGPCRFEQARQAVGGTGLLLPPEYGLLHHLSYVGPPERIRRKLATFSHADEIRPGWFEAVWQAWPSEKARPHLHPTHPEAYGFAERIPVPPLLEAAMKQYRALSGEDDRMTTETLGHGWPSVSVVIPLYGGAEDLAACLGSLAPCQDLLEEILIVDNASPDEAAAEADRFAGVRVLRNAVNRGFPAACNQGLEATSGEIVLFLNSDTVVPRIGLIRLIEALRRSGSIAASGPYSNRVGHRQQIPVTYTSLETLDLFAQDRAQDTEGDVETDMLVGFCLAVKRRVLEEVGGFDERFGLGTFEDNDLCYRMRRAGYRLVIAAQSFVHHAGSRTMARMRLDTRHLLAHNEALYRRKWQADLDSGFASHLAGLRPERITFDPARHPDFMSQRVQAQARQADISLCLIVKNEERVLRDCLTSAQPFFREIIVVDTGSTDDTAAIAQALGAQVYDFPWTDSFAEARNESLRHARGQWIFWMDADDTLPWTSGETILEAVRTAPAEVAGFIVPVQFIEDGTPAGGTRVDHLKLFRNLPGVRFEGRIHEQVLGSLRAAGGQVARLEAVVLHSGYDTSPEGQARKRERDLKLLHLDLAERPDHPFVLFNLGMTYHYIGRHPEAAEWLQRCLAVSLPEESHVRKAYALWAMSLREMGDLAEGLRVLEEGLTLIPDDPELHFHKAQGLSLQGDYETAKRHYEKVLESDITRYFASVDMGILGYKTYHNLGGVCMAMGRYRDAKTWWHKALEAAPRFGPTVTDWFKAALDAGDMAAARQLWGDLYAAEGPSENWTGMGVDFHQALGGNGQGEAFLSQAIEAHPDALGPRLVRVRRLLAEGREAEADPHLRLLNEQGVAEAAYCLGVGAIRQGEWAVALDWMTRALALNPGHPQTQEQIRHLQEALGCGPESPAEVAGEEERAGAAGQASNGDSPA
ncbi:MAG: glycosyltransferase [Armatimonadetes bacterium]|nr:glycosyltransferase [Armatimonadota bacterium]